MRPLSPSSHAVLPTGSGNQPAVVITKSSRSRSAALDRSPRWSASSSARSAASRSSTHGDSQFIRTDSRMRRMLVAVSVDMEGASQLRNVREIYGCMPEYWETGKPRLEADVAAACAGLLAGGATARGVLDNHGGNTVNVAPESLPPGARLETWHVYDLPDHGIDGMFQVGYHARGGVERFLSATYRPGPVVRGGM